MLTTLRYLVVGAPPRPPGAKPRPRLHPAQAFAAYAMFGFLLLFVLAFLFGVSYTLITR